LEAFFLVDATEFFLVFVDEDFVIDDLEAIGALFVLDPANELAFACVLAPARAFLVRTWVTGARRTGSLTASVRCGLIALDVK